MKLTVPAYCEDGIWYPRTTDADMRAARAWSPGAQSNAINAAAATSEGDPFAKYPAWIRPHFDGHSGTMLDAGCGYGRVSIPLLKSNPFLRCIGVDASPVMLKKFVELSTEHGVRDRVELFCGNLRTLPFPDGYFERVLSCAVLLHLPKQEVRAIVPELGRVLARGGTMVLAGSFPNMANPESVVGLWNNYRARDNGPVRVYTRSEVRKLFRDFPHLSIEAHQMIVLPRSIGSVPMPFSNVARAVNRYATEHWMGAFRRSSILVNHHDVVVTK